MEILFFFMKLDKTNSSVLHSFIFANLVFQYFSPPSVSYDPGTQCSILSYYTGQTGHTQHWWIWEGATTTVNIRCVQLANATGHCHSLSRTRHPYTAGQVTQGDQHTPDFLLRGRKDTLRLNCHSASFHFDLTFLAARFSQKSHICCI